MSNLIYNSVIVRLGALLLAVLLHSNGVHAQYSMLFTSNNDLPNSLVNKITEDNKGMIWVATEDGLCKFNGSRFITYRNTPGNSHSLANNFVRTVYADDLGNVIVGTISGVQYYRPQTNDFSEVIESKEDGISGANVNDIAKQKDGSLLVFGGTCFTIRKVKDEWRAEKNLLTGKVRDAYRGIQTSDGSIWISILSSDVLCMSPKGQLRKVKTEQGGMCTAMAFCIAYDGRLIVGTAADGLYAYSSKTRAFHSLGGPANRKPVFDMCRFPGSSQILVATDGSGVYMYDAKSGEFDVETESREPMLDTRKQKVHSIFINKRKDVWTALYQKGIFLTSFAKVVFNYIGHRSPQYNLIGDCCVISLYQTHDGNIWATTDNGGLYGFTSSLTSLHAYPAGVRPDNKGVPSTMLGLYEDSKHRAWFGSYGSGGGQIDLSSGECTYFPIKGGQRRDFNIYSYAEDKRGQMWVASMGNGILRFDEQQKMYVPVKSDNGCQWSNVIFYDKKHDYIYCGTYAGLVSFPATNPKKVKQVEGEAVVYAISYVSDHELSVATNCGLLLVDTNTGNIRKITTEQGLPTNNVYDSKIGNDGHLWISSCNGLTRLDMKTMTTETYTMRDGLQGNEFYKNTGLTTSDGRLLFGGVNGITSFNPLDVDKSHNSCIVRIVDVSADEIYLNPNEDGDYTIPSGADAVTISFGTLPLYMTRRVTYSYSVDGGDWLILAAPQNRVTFDGINYGYHTVRIKTTVDGKDSEITETHLYVEYPWFLKWYMVILWLALLGALGYYVYVNMQRRRVMREKLRAHRVEEEIKESKLQFFMNIVHDLRTPLTLISTPLQKLMKDDRDAERSRLYNVMNVNAGRLLNLTNEIMDLRKLDRGKMELNLYVCLISKTIREIVTNVEDLATSRRHKLVMTDHTDGKQMMMLDYQAFEKILINLLGNAGKYTPEGGLIEVEWDVVPSQPSREKETNAESNHQASPVLVLSVTDNGIGISDEHKKRVFERFYQVRINDKHIKGTGIGLNLVKALVDLFKGEITVTDNPAGKGSRFTVVLPLGKVTDADGVVADATDVATVADVADNESDGTQVVGADNGAADVAGQENDKQADDSQTAASQHGGTGRVVLVVDDDDDIRNFLCEELAAIYNVLEAADGKSAYDILNKENVDLVVSDVMMPEIDGIELTKMIRKNVRLSHLPVILLTAKASDQDRIEGLQTTADAYVTKPFNLELLETLIGNLIMRQEKLRNTFKGNELPTDRIETPVVSSADDKLMERLVKVINENLDNPDLTSEMLAREVGLSRVHMYRKLKELTNQSATNYIRNIRLTKAAEILRQGNATVSEVAYLVGFRTPAHFSTAFKELYGMSPKEYMKKG